MKMYVWIIIPITYYSYCCLHCMIGTEIKQLNILSFEIIIIVFHVIHLNVDELSKITFFSKQHTAKSIFVEWNRSSIVNKIDYKLLE